MKKRILALFLAAVMVMVMVPSVFAADSDFEIENGLLIRYNGPGGDVVIPNGVTSIGDYSFSGCYNLTSVTLPEGVTIIGNYAFSSCSSLLNVTIPDGVTTIGEGAFSFCESLSSVTIPASVTSIEEWAFWHCALTSVTIPDGVTTIDNCAFFDCGYLADVMISASVTSIGKGAFSACFSLPAIDVDESNQYYTSVDGVLYSKDMKTLCQFPAGKKVTGYQIPNGVTTILREAFYFCSFLNNVTIPDSVTSVGSNAFFGLPLNSYVYYGGSQEEWDAIDCVYEDFVDKHISFADGGWEKAGLGGVNIRYNSTGPTKPASTFSDVKPGEWYAEAVQYVAGNGLMKGSGAGKFNPTATITRAEVAQILYNRADAPGAGSAVFSDVPKDQWFYDAVTWAADQGLVQGSGGAFTPSGNITREQLAIMLYNAAGKGSADVSALNGYPDAGAVNTWARTQMAWAVESGIITGSNGQLNPQGYASRAEAATMLMRFCEKYSS